MPRLESVAKAGYFPTPDEVVERIGSLIRPARTVARQTVRLLDPCCGTGAALHRLAGMVGGETYGIEVSKDRWEEAQQSLDHALGTSAFATRLAHGGFSCLWLNPPYDYADDGKRLEHTFLTNTTRCLCPGGVLVFIVPQRRLAVSARYLAAQFTQMTCYRFPGRLYEEFHQVLLVAVKKRDADLTGKWKERVEAWATTDLPELPEAGAAEPQYELPALPAGPVVFSSQFFDAESAAEEARRYGLWTSPVLAERLWPTEERQVRPLMPLRRGHLAVLIAAGFLNNILLEANGKRVLVKGRTYKESVHVESDDPNVEVEREVLRTSVMALDLASGRFQTIQQGGTEVSEDGSE